MSDELTRYKVGNIIHFGGYDWRVLKVHNGKALVLSDKVIDNRRYHHTEEKTTWDKCELRNYLNKEFYFKFSPQDKKLIVETKITTNNNPWYDTDGGSEVNDKIFLLSIEEVIKYFGDSGDLENRKSWYWDDNESIVKEGADGGYLNDKYNNERIAKNKKGMPAWWWLRSLGSSKHRIARVRDNGIICVHGSVTRGLSDSGGIRPALWLNL